MEHAKEFLDDLAWSEYASGLLEPYYEKRYVETKWMDEDFQKKFDIDRKCYKENGTSVYVEEKCVRNNWDNILVEDISSTNINSPGWIHTSLAEVLLWAYCPIGGMEINIYTFDMYKLQDWWENEGSKNLSILNKKHIQGSLNKSLSYKVGISYLDVKGILLEHDTIKLTKQIKE